MTNNTEEENLSVHFGINLGRVLERDEIIQMINKLDDGTSGALGTLQWTQNLVRLIESR